MVVGGQSARLGSQPNDVFFAALLVLDRGKHVVLGVTLMCFSQVGLGTVVMTTSAEHIPDTRKHHDTDGNDGGIVEVGRRDRLNGRECQDDAFKDCQGVISRKIARRRATHMSKKP